MSRSPEDAPTAVLVRRYVAHLVDAVLGALAVGATMVLLGERSTVSVPDGARVVDAFRLTPQYGLRIDDQQVLLSRQDVLAAAAVGLAFVMLFLVITQGRFGWTIGKAVTGIRTVDGDGGRPGIGRALLRTVLLVLDVVPSVVLPLVGGAFILVTRTNRRLGDLVTGTYVVDRHDVGEFPDGTRVLDPDDLDTDAEPLPVTTLDEGESLRVGEAADPADRPAPAPDRGPRWDPARKAYLQWDPRRRVWLQYDDADQEWRPIT